MKDRIKTIRKEARLNQTKFGERLGVSLSAVQKWELGLNQPDAPSVRLICDRFHVNERWLRTGEGDMRPPDARETEIAQAVAEMMADASPSFRSALVQTLIRLDPDGPEWDVLEQLYKSVAGQIDAQE